MQLQLLAQIYDIFTVIFTLLTFFKPPYDYESFLYKAAILCCTTLCCADLQATV